MAHSIRCVCLALLLPAVFDAAADPGRNRTAAPATAHLRISLTITPHIGMQVVTAPASLAISRADIARGYVDVPEAVSIAVQTNLADGFAVSLANEAAQVRQAELHAVGERPAARRAVATGLHGTLHAWRVRLHLADGAEAGEFAWPLRIAVGF